MCYINTRITYVTLTYMMPRCMACLDILKFTTKKSLAGGWAHHLAIGKPRSQDVSGARYFNK